MGLSRFLNKRVLFGEGLFKGGDSEAPGVLFEDGKVKSIGSHDVEGDVTATGVIANSLKFKGSTALTNIWGLVASLTIGTIGIHGSLNSTAVVNTAMSGVSVGDLVFGNPVGSCHNGLMWGVACHSAGNVQVRACYLGSGEYGPGVVPFKLYCIK